MRQSKVRFIVQQGLPAASASDDMYEALMFQPRTIGGLVLLGALLQSTWLFLALSAVLWWSTLVPTRNPFDAIYNHLVAKPRGRLPLGIAPGPRLFAQSMSATLALVIGGALLIGAAKTVWALEGLFGVAVILVVFGDFCEGAYLYHVLRGALIWLRSKPTPGGARTA
jgi:hypothetical protein